MNNLVSHELVLRNRGSVRVLIDRESADVASGFLVGVPSDDMLVRIQSRCLYGEVLGSVDCDCRDQLDASLDQIFAEECGLIIYLEQEGRGSGLLSKALAYALKASDGLDTFAAYEHLGIPRDERDYADAAALLGDLNVSRVRLLTNNPRKIAALESAGIGVTRVPAVSPVVHQRAVDYLAAKKASGHLL